MAMRKINASSDIPKARSLIKTGIKLGDWRYIKAALPLMTRAKAVRRARQKQKPITAAQKRAVLVLVKQDPDMHYHEIANRVGLANGGRVSEIVTGRRK